MKQKLLTTFFAFLMIAGIAQAQTDTGTITNTLSVTSGGSGITNSGTTSITITREGAYTVVATISYAFASGVDCTINQFSLNINGVNYPAAVNATVLGTTPSTIKLAIPVVIASAGTNSMGYGAFTASTVSAASGVYTFGPVGLEFYTDASALATQALITAQSAQITALTTAINGLTTTATQQSADLATLQSLMSSLQSQFASINTNSSAAQLTAIQSQLNRMTKDIKRYGVSTSNPWFLANFGLDGATFGTSIYSGFNGQSAGTPSMEGSVMARPGFYEKN